MNKLTEEFLRLVGIMDELREKCPWDREQTLETLRSMTIEETYELADSVTEKNWKGIREELGDLLLHILFYSRIAKEQQQFTLEEVIQGISEKLITRHPHIYGDVNVENEEDVKRKWENKEQVWQKVEEEINELHEAVAKGETEKIEDEFGDLIFSLINYARFLRIDPENALERTNKKFIDRFTKMETEALQQSKKLDEMTLEEMDAIWNTIKHRHTT